MSSPNSLAVSSKKRKRSGSSYEHKHYVFVHYGFGEEQWAPAVLVPMMSHLLATLDTVRARYSIERCPTTGRLHLQGWLDLKYRMTITKIQAGLQQAFLPDFGFLQPRESNDQSYIHKNFSHVDGPWSYTQESIPNFVEEKKESGPKKVLWVSGDFNTGKSYYLTQIFSWLYDSPYQFPGRANSSRSRWLGDYQGQQFVVIDEFNPKDFGRDELKLLLDRGPQVVARSMGGKSVLFSPAFVLLLSNHKSDAIRAIFAHRPELKTRVRAVWTNFRLFYSDFGVPEVSFL